MLLACRHCAWLWFLSANVFKYEIGCTPPKTFPICHTLAEAATQGPRDLEPVRITDHIQSSESALADARQVTILRTTVLILLVQLSRLSRYGIRTNMGEVIVTRRIDLVLREVLGCPPIYNWINLFSYHSGLLT